MSTKQTWTIRGQVYNHEQLLELKRQGLDPRKDDIVMKFVTPKSTEVTEEEPSKAMEIKMTTSTTDETVVLKEGETKVVATLEEPSKDESHFAELEKKGYRNLQGEERELYRTLKEKLNK